MTTGTSVSPLTDEREDSRAERHRALRLLWRRPQHVREAGEVVMVDGFPKRVTKVSVCMHHSIAADALVKIRVTPTPEGPRAGFAGLMTCGSVWVCPVCSNKIATERAMEIAVAVNRWEEMGGRVAMLTLTMRHSYEQGLEELWDALTAAWHRVTSGREWIKDQEKYGCDQVRFTRKGEFERTGERKKIVRRLPWVRAVEVTHGQNGWHVHVHVLLFMSPVKVAKMRANGGQRLVDTWPVLIPLAASMFGRWSDALVDSGLKAPIATLGGDGIGRDIRWIARGSGGAMSDYFTKSQYSAATVAGLEAARGMQKKGRKGGRAPFEILANVVHNLDNADDPALQKSAVRDLARWYEWERVSKGRRQITWALGLRALLRLGDEKSDDEIAAEDKSTDDTVTAGEFDAASFVPIRRDLGGALLAAEIWYVVEYLATCKVVPAFAAGWSKSYFEDRVKADRVKAALRTAPVPSVAGRLGDDWERCMGCGEHLDAMLMQTGRHLGC